MPKLTVEGSEPVDVGADRRLVLGIEQDAHVDIMHACGGFARCTTCRVEFIEGEPKRMTTCEISLLNVGTVFVCEMVITGLSRLSSTHDSDTA